MIGIFDSGLGGLTVWRSLREALPNADILYLADQAHVPYGDRDVADLQHLLRVNLGYLERMGAEPIVAGCNTSCAIARRFGWPPSRSAVIDIIEAGARAAVATGAAKIGILATAATTRMGAYGDAIRALAPAVEVEEIAAPMLVPLIESGRLAGPEMRAAISEALERFRSMPQTLVYGCTHYPLADDTFALLLGDTIARIDPAQAQAQQVIEWFGAAPPVHTGRTIFRTTGEPMLFREQILALAGSYRDVDTIGLVGAHHDVGGGSGSEPISQAQHAFMPWEMRVDALMWILSDTTRPGGARITVDELRRGIEALPASDYRDLGYYAKWLRSMLGLMHEHGAIDRGAVERRALELTAAHEHEHL